MRITQGTRVTAHLTNSNVGRIEFAGTVEDIYQSGRQTIVVVKSDDGVERFPLVENVTPAEETDSEGRRIVTVKGKRYIVGTITPARPKTPGAKSWTPEAYVRYWSERNGERFGATRFASASCKPGTVGRAVWDAVN